jgi:hypothetical protein
LISQGIAKKMMADFVAAYKFFTGIGAKPAMLATFKIYDGVILFQ